MIFNYRYEQKEADLLKSLNEAEIEKEDETSTLFRGASLTTTIMDLYMKSVCTNFLQTALKDTITKLLESKVSCEVLVRHCSSFVLRLYLLVSILLLLQLNPSKMDSPDDACLNAEFLLQILDEVTLSIFLSVDSCPR